jgi:hypothetical protein
MVEESYVMEIAQEDHTDLNVIIKVTVLVLDNVLAVDVSLGRVS